MAQKCGGVELVNGILLPLKHWRGRRGCDRMVVGFITILMQSVPITTNVVSSNSTHAVLARYILKTTLIYLRKFV